jgi:DNA-binding NarL/FixJ family response regulator
MTKSQRTAVVHDRHPLWLQALEDVLRHIDVAAVAKRTDSQDALAAIEEHSPDLFVTELWLAASVAESVGVVRRAVKTRPELNVVALSADDDPRLIDEALDAGAVAFVLKTAHPDDIASALRQTFDHSVYLPSLQVRRPTPLPVHQLRGDPRLTRREQEILRLLAEGYSNAQLARLLWVTEQTIKFHLSNVYRKLEVKNRTEAARWAQLHGYAVAPTNVA